MSKEPKQKNEVRITALTIYDSENAMITIKGTNMIPMILLIRKSTKT